VRKKTGWLDESKALKRLSEKLIRSSQSLPSFQATLAISEKNAIDFLSVN
jgi:hypothetical protein